MFYTISNNLIYCFKLACNYSAHMVRRANTIGAKRKHHSCGGQTSTQIAIKLTPNYLRKYKYISSNHEIKT